MTRVTITFMIDEEGYNDYEDILDTFLNDMDVIGMKDVDVTEEEV